MSQSYVEPDPETKRVHAAMVKASIRDGRVVPTGLFYDEGIPDMILHLSPSVLYRDCAAGHWLMRFAAALKEPICD